jgi:hypothetical protein
LSKTWKPRMYSSMSKGSRKPPGRLRILEKVSKSTVVASAVLETRVQRVSLWGESGRRTVCANTALEIANLSQCRVLPTCAQQVTERRAVDTAVAALVEELERLAVVGGSLVAVIHCCSVAVTEK